MATSGNLVLAQTPYLVNLSLAAVTACTTRAPTATASLAAANIFLLVPASTNGCRIDQIRIKACSSAITAPTAAQMVTIWEWDGTNAYPIDEILVSIVTPAVSATISFQILQQYQGLVLPLTHALYASTTVTTTAATTALCITAIGALL